MNKNFLVPLIILVIIGGFIYSFNIDNPLFWDDDDWIINNVSVHSITWDNVKFWFTHNTLAGVGLPSNYYRPFLFFTFALNWVIAGVKPLIWHLTSNAVHLANAVLVFVLIGKIFGSSDVRRTSDDRVLEVQPPKSSRRLNLGIITAFLTALIFVIHPLNTEAVTYIAGRGDPLVALFMLAALWLMFGSSTSKHWYRVRIALPPILLALALLSRETAIIFPLLFMLVSLMMSQEKFLVSLKKSFVKALPFFGVVLVYGILRLTVLNFQNTLNFYPVANVYSESLYVRLLTFGGVLIEYAKLLFVPIGLHMERSSVVYTSLFQWPIWLVFSVVVGLFWFLVYLYRKNLFQQSQITNSKHQIPNKFQNSNSKTENLDIENSLEIGNWKFPKIPDFRVWLFGLGWFFIGLAPVSGITPINAVMYEHWLYLPMVGVWAITVFYLVKLLNYQGPTFLKIQGRTLIIAALIVYFTFFGWQSIKRNILWGKPLEFFQDILKYEPKSTRINNNLGNLYFNRGDTERAEKYYWSAAESGDNFPQPHYNLGSILQARGDIHGAVVEYEKAIEIDPNFFYPYQNLMAIYANQGELGKAIEYVEILKRLKPYDPRVFYNSALIHLARGDRDIAARDLKTGLKVIGADLEAEQLIKTLLSKLEK